uniref:Uncharacterized protein n=1 Tax=Ditylenchus dipsaci TaxID=166011 RepID=A0A915DTQ6_9BILA
MKMEKKKVVFYDSFHGSILSRTFSKKQLRKGGIKCLNRRTGLDSLRRVFHFKLTLMIVDFSHANLPNAYLQMGQLTSAKSKWRTSEKEWQKKYFTETKIRMNSGFRVVILFELAIFSNKSHIG